MCVLYYAHKKHICAFFVCLQVIAMKELMKEVLPILRDAAYRQVQYPPEYAIQCRRAEAAYQALWDSFSPEQRKLYLRYEAERNAQEALEEEHLICRVFALARELYR